jgi:tRNA (Thr-GGU) A37 N-methylase
MGKRVGIFSTRSPHRPNPIGLTLTKLEKIKGTQVEVSGLDLISGTPVLDIKPYIPKYDMPIQNR